MPYCPRPLSLDVLFAVPQFPAGTAEAEELSGSRSAQCLVCDHDLHGLGSRFACMTTCFMSWLVTFWSVWHFRAPTKLQYLGMRLPLSGGWIVYNKYTIVQRTALFHYYAYNHHDVTTVGNSLNILVGFARTHREVANLRWRCPGWSQIGSRSLSELPPPGETVLWHAYVDARDSTSTNHICCNISSHGAFSTAWLSLTWRKWSIMRVENILCIETCRLYKWAWIL